MYVYFVLNVLYSLFLLNCFVNVKVVSHVNKTYLNFNVKFDLPQNLHAITYFVQLVSI